MGPDDRADVADEDVLAREDPFEHVAGTLEVRCGGVGHRKPSERAGLAHDLGARYSSEPVRVRWLDSASTTPSRISMIGLIDSSEPMSAVAAPMRPPLRTFSIVSSAPKTRILEHERDGRGLAWRRDHPSRPRPRPPRARPSPGPASRCEVSTTRTSIRPRTSSAPAQAAW